MIEQNAHLEYLIWSNISAPINNDPSNGVLEEFRLEFLQFWHRLPNKSFFFILLFAWLALFQFLGSSTLGYIGTRSLMQQMYKSYHPKEDVITEDGHGLIVPFIVLGILWWKRKELASLRLDTWWPALLLLVWALGLHLLGYRVQQSRISILAMFIGIYALTGLAWGRTWLLKSIFPFILLLFCIPLGSLAQPITFPLRLLVTKIVELISHAVSVDVLREGTILKDPTGTWQYEVAAACSGIRSLFATVLFALAYGMISFRPWWKRGVIIASAVPLAVLGNVMRMLTIVFAAEIGGQETGNYVHEGGPAGIISLLPYIPAFFGLLMLGSWLERQGEPNRARSAEPDLPAGLAGQGAAESGL